VVLDVQGFPAMLNWYLVHNRTKRLPPVAAAFKDFLLREGAPLLEKLVRFDPHDAAGVAAHARTGPQAPGGMRVARRSHRTRGSQSRKPQ